MPAKGKWDLTRRLKGYKLNVLLHNSAGAVSHIQGV